jgi:type I restriction-modification system DNA methylase subunit
MQTIEEIIKTQSHLVVRQIREATSWTESEEDLRIATERILGEFKNQAKLQDFRGHHEVTIGKGRADSVYNYVVIEYKKPKRLSESNTATGNREVIEQLKTRLYDLEKEERRKITKLFGIGFDGHWFIFVRFRNNSWEISNPLPVTPQTTERFLRALLSLAATGKAFQPAYLSGDFGADSLLSGEGIKTFYKAITNSENPKAQVLFDEWKILFGEVGGYDVKAFEEKIQVLAEFYHIKGKPDPSALLFSVHTYYALFMKLLAAEIMNYFNPMFPSILSRLHQIATGEKLLRELRELEKGGIYRQMGITNFLEGDMFSWYLEAWDTKDKKGEKIDLERVIRDMIGRLDEYDPVTLSIETGESRDLLKELYQNLFPQKIRHDLGEYYTPDWLAQWVIEKVGIKGNPDERILDPACGSGTFLVLAIQKVREFADEKMIPEKELLKKINENVIGFDLNPLAVIAARLNYLIAIRDLIKYGNQIEIPVYLCDSVMTPSEYGELFTNNKGVAAPGGRRGAVKELKTSAETFYIPTEIAASRGLVARYAEELEYCVQHEYSPEEFIQRLKEEDLPVLHEDLHKDLFNMLTSLNKRDKNGIWARIIKNAFAPLFIQPVDYVIGNPPWVNWESLPGEYRQDSKELWFKYNLFPHKGMDAILGKGKKDISMIMTYVAMDKYLKAHGRLGFVITQSVFKTSGAGQGFRRFRINNEIPIAPVYCDDMVKIKPFEAANRTAVIVLERDKELEYPVPYTVWKKKERQKIDSHTPLSAVLERTLRDPFVGKPVDGRDKTSAWITGKTKALEAVNKVLGESAYKAHEGVNTGGANGVYWVEILQELAEGKVLVRNITEGAKRKVRQAEAVIEKDLLYPLVRGRDVRRWQAKPSAHIIMVQDPQKRRGIDESIMKQKYPLTYTYLKQFERVLKSRAAYRRYFKESDPFYSMFDVGSYTLAPWKVSWRYIASEFTCSVISADQDYSNNLIIPDHRLIVVSFQTPEEAHYLCAVLNSAPSRYLVNSYVISTQISTHVLHNIYVPRFDLSVPGHQELASLSKQAHQVAKTGDGTRLRKVEAEIDKLTAPLWNLTAKELRDIQASLKAIVSQ